MVVCLGSLTQLHAMKKLQKSTDLISGKGEQCVYIGFCQTQLSIQMPYWNQVNWVTLCFMNADCKNAQTEYWKNLLIEYMSSLKGLTGIEGSLTIDPGK